MRRFILGGNWKMQITRLGEAERIAENIAAAIENVSSVEVFIAPSFNALNSVGLTITKTKLKLAGQNMHYHEKGAFTGEISVLSLIEAGCEYVILGHSERRRIFGEKDDTINQKVLLAINHGLKPVLCIGETAEERANGRTAEVNQSQLAGSLRNVSAQQLQNVIIAYEPVWAIDNKFLNPNIEIKPATPEQASEAHMIVRDWIRKHYGQESAANIPIIYGGSMKEKNATELLTIEDIDGGLVGGASLSAEAFVPIIRSAEKLAKGEDKFEWDSNTLRFNE
ncbi:MAG: triose-phosphate isomerase [Candidatus Heimdallarchaeota archaeon]|nr:MAG: triose-phosphate isomerase [Candidatus Heimdallarchaeota archaeon]